ncbi:MAG: phosphoglycerate kinase [Alphaproteobacteria bacterium GM7ARS4]|nr:phosphoglycerate kinase [Alphaproteobacteria bacterium GM7ARS4]
MRGSGSMGVVRSMPACVSAMSLSGARLFVRCDFNVPMTDDGQIRSRRRIERVLPALRSYLERGASLVVVSHMGRPQHLPSHKHPPKRMSRGDKKLSLRPVFDVVRKALAPYPCVFVKACIGDAVKAQAHRLEAGSVLMLENVRFHEGEDVNGGDFVEALLESSGATHYVHEAFSCAHRAHASTYGVAKRLPAYAGVTFYEELSALERFFSGDDVPRVAVVGGAKVSTKLASLMNLVRRVDSMLIGGAMAHSFLVARGVRVYDSLYEEERLKDVQRVCDVASQAGCQLVIPCDGRVLDKEGVCRYRLIEELQEGDAIMDIGCKTLDMFRDHLDKAATVLWNGPLGAFEREDFSHGTREIADFLRAKTTSGHMRSVIGGGDTLAAVERDGDDETMGFSYASTAGGAFLEWCEGKTLPGIEVLTGER